MSRPDMSRPELVRLLLLRLQQGKGWGGETSQVSRGADTKANTIGRGGALEVGDHSLLEDSSESGGALDSDIVVLETASEGWDGDGERAGMSMGPDTKANTIWGGGALQLLEHAVPLDAARDNDGGGNAQILTRILTREVNLLNRLCALELVDLKRVPVDTAKEGRGMR